MSAVPSSDWYSTAPNGLTAVESHGAAVVFKLAGDIATEKVSRVTDAIDAFLTRGPRALILDLSNVTFMASAVMDLVVDSCNRLDPIVPLRVVTTHASVTETALASKIDPIAIFSTLEEALGTE